MDNKLVQTDKLAYSYHTFLLAFSFDDNCQFHPQDKIGNWEKDSLRNINDRGERIMNYKTYQYFTPEARKLMFNDDKIVRYKYNIPEDADRGYVIRKTLEKEDENNKDKRIRYSEEYRLTIDNIRVTVFNNRIAIMQFELENHDPKHQKLEFVKRINEYGRRINLPYIAGGDDVHELVADSVSILGDEVKFSCFGEKALEDFRTKSDNQNIIPPIMNLIRELFPDITDKTKFIPVIDDRMFVCCLVRDDEFSDKAKSLIKTDDDPIPTVGRDIYTDRELSNEIYSFAYIDADDSSCQSLEMRAELLKRCIYSRWRDWGTFDVVTHHSFVRVTGTSDSIKDSVIYPFLTQYITMAAGVLLQRATLMKLSAECAEISDEYFENNQNKQRKKNSELDKRIRRLKRDYVYAQNNIFLNQFTAQEQGIDEFDMLRNEMYVEDLLKSLDDKVNGIYDFSKENAEDEENRLLNTLTEFGVPLAIMQVLTVIISFASFEKCIDKNSGFEWLLLCIILAGSIALSVIGIKALGWWYTHKSKKDK